MDRHPKKGDQETTEKNLYLEKSGLVWKIARVDAAQRIKTLVPYGTPVQ